MSASLAYQGEPIRRRDEKLCLTDMWRANGADPSKRPSDWTRKDGAQFVDFTAENLNMPLGHIIEAERGRDGGTWAHWQIGFAYAKYLSPAFHAWCNEVVRDHMEGVLRPPPQAMAVVDVIAFGAEIGKHIALAVGTAIEPIDRRLSAVEVKVEEGLAALRREVSAVEAGQAALYARAAGRRKAFNSDTRAKLLYAAHRAGGLCPCCKENRITNPDGSKALRVEFHHIGRVDDPSVENGIPLCVPCHRDFTRHPAAMLAEYGDELKAFHNFRKRNLQQMPLPGLV